MANKNRRRQNSNGTSSSSAPPPTSLENITTNNTNNTNAAKNLTTTSSHVNNNDEDHESPLRLFGDAKDTINGLYERLDTCVRKASDFYSNNQLDPEVVNNVDNERLCKLSKSIETIKSVLARNQMKVAFFGRTSNGKSTVINAILHDKVLPMGYGHTTACFLQIEGNEENEAFLEVQKDGQQGEKRPIQSVSNIANALNSGTLEYSTLVKIHWPITKCPLLKYDVVLVDSPGVDVEENLDEWIDEHCHDADVFVLVSNAESTLNIAEKNFFHKVSEKLSKPNIFILNNRWDSIADDLESMDQVRGQHVERAVSFLSDELKISTKEEARLRTFFVSARETLLARSPTKQNDSPSGAKREGYEERSEEFKNFERRFEESLSKSAVQTKFQKHTDKGRETINELINILNSTQSLVMHVSQRKLLELHQSEDRYKSIHTLFHANENGLIDEIFNIKKKIQIVADTEFDNEIRRLSRLVEDFEYDFSPNPIKIREYKEQLYLYVEESLSENLKSRINTVISKHVNPFNKVMCDISLLLSNESQQKTKYIVESQTYVQDELFDLKIYKQFYTDFQEDLEFRFSLGLVSIIRKFQSKFSPASTSKSSLSASPPDQLSSNGSMSANTDFLAVLERFMMNPPQSPTTVGSLAVGGVLVRTVGWKVIIITTVVYGALYAYEYLTWTNAAKERAFKAQYVKFARKGLHDCVPIISQHIANSVEQKLSNTFAKVKEEVDSESTQISSKIGLLKLSLNKLRMCDEFTRELLGENDVLLNELMAFATSFLIS